MFGRWLRFLLWQPFALMCRRFPLWPFRATITYPIDLVICIRIDNLLTRLLSRFSGGYDYAVCYLIDGSLVIDTGFPWARRRLKKSLIGLGADRSITTVVNTHYHEDHAGNNDLVDWLSFGDGWLSLITGSDFSRGNIVKSFLRDTQHTNVSIID